MSGKGAFKDLADKSIEAAGADPAVLKVLLSVMIKGYMGMALVMILGSTSMRSRIRIFY